mmetsp:Transcript_9726/g.20143  ORF Transcript_9726/g.20143 Transcript_9726/m.20143 type:complete len:615 (-) Transcript_9726:1845-3689(-)|eukprot:CAMPEP_0172441406 /NCGR_PEP_ID=MMETSP1065-20121228/1961_1 /TAXON_ID=265537 /ORGANISM="Amphiprora paludosa, Strain CCMP125" /LENGTH=614 /DNA_ID=CAMNT_0013190767 /DNA_START=196 /DNA_END=2040 /DNA_ORIENTATION=-
MTIISRPQTLYLCRIASLFFLIRVCISYQHDENECGVYFAPSTIPGAGFGMFAGIDYKEGEAITPGDLVVPYSDFAFHNGVDSNRDLPFIWNEYAWSSRSFDYMDEEAISTSGASFGLGAAVNCHFPLLNFVDDYETMKFDGAGLHRSRDPGAGAITPYHNRVGVSMRHIPAGMELFLSYGEGYFDKPEYSMVPFQEDYKAGDEVLDKFVNFRNEIIEELKPNIAHSFPESMLSLIHGFKNIWSSKVLNTLPENPLVLDKIADQGVEYVHYNRSIHSINFLREYGTCMDNLEAKQSTIEQAGRGAFTRRPIVAGQTIAPVPLVHVPHRIMLSTYPAKDGPYPDLDDDERDASLGPRHKQLLLNYCFGHRDLRMLLCPYGVGTALVNHSKEKANAKMVWSEKSTQHPEWFETPVNEWIFSLHSGLAFDFVATKDIAVGEEVLIDYGDEWEAAWQEHIHTWTPPLNSEDYHPSYELDRMENLEVKTIGEGYYSTRTYNLRCREVFRPLWGLLPFDGVSYPCHAIDRYDKDGETVYNVEILLRVHNEEGTICEEELEEVLFGVPRQIFVFEDNPYSRDHAQTWSFRHDMRIPDELIPSAWLPNGTCSEPVQGTSIEF